MKEDAGGILFILNANIRDALLFLPPILRNNNKLERTRWRGWSCQEASRPTKRLWSLLNLVWESLVLHQCIAASMSTHASRQREGRLMAMTEHTIQLLTGLNRLQTPRRWWIMRLPDFGRKCGAMHSLQVERALCRMWRIVDNRNDLATFYELQRHVDCVTLWNWRTYLVCVQKGIVWRRVGTSRLCNQPKPRSRRKDIMLALRWMDVSDWMYFDLLAMDSDRLKVESLRSTKALIYRNGLPY